MAVYYPSNKDFKHYDLIVMAYKNKDDHPQIYGYQLKLGKKYAEKGIRFINDQCCKRFWVRGEATKAVSGCKEKAVWHIVTDGEIDNFFGASGVNWKPKVWETLTGKK